MQKEAFEPTGLIPRSIIRTFDRFLQQLLPGSESVAIQEYRVSRYQILVSIQSLFVLVCIPFFVNYAVKLFLLTPLTEHFWNSEQKEIFLNAYQEKRAFAEMQDFSEKIFFESLLRDKQPNHRLDLMQLELLSPSRYQTFLSFSKERFDNDLEAPPYQIQKHSTRALNQRWSSLKADLLSESAQNDKYKQCRPISVESIPTMTNSSQVKIQQAVLTQPWQANSGYGHSRLEDPSWTQKQFNSILLIGDKVRAPTSQFLGRDNISVLWPTDCDNVLSKDVISLSSKIYDIDRSDQINSPRCGVYTPGPLRPEAQAQSKFGKNCAYKQQWQAFFARNRAVKACSVLDQSSKLFTSNISAPLPTQGINSCGGCSCRGWRVNATATHRDDKAPVNDPATMFTRQPPHPQEQPLQEAWASVYNNKNALFDQRSCDESFLWQEEYNLQKQFQSKSLQIASRYNQQSILAITNTCADFISVCTLYLLSVLMKPQIIILKSFLIESIYSLSDTTKSFLLILGMDLLVGFHSPRGWEIALETLLRHFGLPENENFILLFVALFPVFLDTVFKYWIFRYLNKISPSTVVTYHSMLE